MDRRPVLFVLGAAVLYGVGLPLSKVLLGGISPLAMAGLLYCGAFLGLAPVYAAKRLARRRGGEDYSGLKKKDLPWLAGSILSGGFAAPVLLMGGLALSSGFSASLLSNLEGVATALIAVLLFREMTDRRLWLALGCMVAGAFLLSWNGGEGRFDAAGPLLIVLSMVCWGIDNNVTRQISSRDPLQIATIKSLFAGTVPLLIVSLAGMDLSLDFNIVYALVVGAFGYGASLVLFILALRGLGASRTAAIFGVAPFVGAVASLLILNEWLGWVMVPAVALMALGAWLVAAETHGHAHRHEPLVHDHPHTHDDEHHGHPHSGPVTGGHTHEHAHTEVVHEHPHYPDMHHRHRHD
jgi:drug/metabolite transporter (DMT)-like permease